jgi:hypothetical protein
MNVGLKVEMLAWLLLSQGEFALSRPNLSAIPFVYYFGNMPVYE